MASDIHGSRRAAEKVRSVLAAESPDLFVACGDITNFGPVAWAEEFLRSIPVRTVAVPGNCDPRDIVEVLDRLGVDLHKKRREIDGVPFVGIGGSNPTPFGTPFELSEDEIRRALEPLMVPDAVLVSHAPPRGFVDVVPRAGHVGSAAVREAVDRHRPRLVLCGHVHESPGIVPGPTTIVNPGAAKDGRVAIVDLGHDVRARIA